MHGFWLIVCALVWDVGRLGVTHVWGLAVVPLIAGVAVSIARTVDASLAVHRFADTDAVLHFIRLTGIGCLVVLTGGPRAFVMAEGV